jgi:Spy/CpxP family protein refolding chaperone
MRCLAALLIACFLLAVSASAQKTANLPWWTSPVVTDLGLSQEQSQHIRQIVRSYRNRLFDARNAANKAEADLQDLLNEPTVNLASARPTIERLSSARAETTRLFTSMSVELRGVLTQAQWRELIKRWTEVQSTRRNSDTDVAP